MKEYLILKDFEGTQDGFGDGEHFAAGTVRRVSDALAKALGSGYLREAAIAAQEIAQAPLVLADAVLEAMADPEDIPGISTETGGIAEGEIVGGFLEDRETKVDAPEETKPARGRKKK